MNCIHKYNLLLGVKHRDAFYSLDITHPWFYRWACMSQLLTYSFTHPTYSYVSFSTNQHCLSNTYRLPSGQYILLSDDILIHTWIPPTNTHHLSSWNTSCPPSTHFPWSCLMKQQQIIYYLHLTTLAHTILFLLFAINNLMWWCHFKNTPVVVNNPIDNESFLKVD